MARFVLDEDVQLSLAGLLRGRGHQAWHVLEAGLQGSTDDAVVAFASERQAVLVTADLGIADIRSLGSGPHFGILLLRMPQEMPTHRINAEILALLHDFDVGDMQDKLVVVEPGRIRIRKAP